MAERLPLAPITVPQVRAPQGPVSPADIRAPFDMLARAFQLEGAASEKQGQAQESIARSIKETGAAKVGEGRATQEEAQANMQEARAFVQTSEEVSRFGEIVQRDIAIPAAERAGRDSVRAGPDGKVIVEPPPFPIIGPAAKAYESAANFDYLARVKPEMEAKLTEMRLQFHGDPAGYQKAADAYVKTMMANAPNVVLRSAVGQAGFDSAGQNFRTSMVEADNLNKTNTLQSLKAQLEAIDQKQASLAHQGGVETPEYIQGVKDRQAIYDKLVADPRFGFTKERAQIELKASRDDDVTEALIGSVVREFRTKNNVAEAQKALATALFGEGSEKLNVDMDRRYKALGRGQSLLERVGVEDKAAKAALHQTVTQYWNEVVENPQLFSDKRHHDYVQQAVKLGDNDAILKLDSIRRFAPALEALRRLPVDEQAAALGTLARGYLPALPTRLANRDAQTAVEAEARRQGVPAALAVRVVQLESGGDPAAVRGSYKGLFQLSESEYAAGGGGPGREDMASNVRAGVASMKRKIGAFQDEFNRMPTATEVYLMHQQGEAGLRAHLAQPDRPAWQSMLSTGEGQKKGEGWAKRAIADNIPAEVIEQAGGIDKLTSRDFVRYWESRVVGTPYEGSGMYAGMPVGEAVKQNPYVLRMWENAIVKQRSRAATSAEFLANEIVKDAAAGNDPPVATLKTFGELVVASGRHDLMKDKVAPVLEARAAVAAAAPGGAPALAQLQHEINVSMARGGHDPYTQQALRAAAEQALKVQQNWEKDTLTEGAKQGFIDKLHPISPDNPAVAAHEFREREVKQQTLRQLPGRNIGASTILSPPEGEQMKTTLTKGAANVAAGMLQSLRGSLSIDNWRATLYMDQMRDALGEMARSTDPARQAPAMEALSELWKTDPAGFNQKFGSPTTTMLQTWLALRGQFSDAEIAVRLNEAADPNKREVYDKQKTAATAEAEKYSVNDMLQSYAGAWTWLPSMFQKTIGTVPAAPSETFREGSLAGAAFQVDWTNTYTELRRGGVAADKAAEQAGQRLRATWGPTTAVGESFLGVGVTRLMKHPPEHSPLNKPIEGYSNWMEEQLHELVTSIKGPQFPADKEELAPGIPAQSWKIMGLISDAKTEADLKAGRSPRYGVRILDMRTGTDEILSQPLLGAMPGEPVQLIDRFAFDRASALKVYDQRMKNFAAVAGRELAGPGAGGGPLLRVPAMPGARQPGTPTSAPAGGARGQGGAAIDILGAQ